MKKFITPLLLVFIINIAGAQTTTTEKSSHYKAAEELLTGMKLGKMTEDMTTQMLDMQIKSNPMLEAKRPAMLAFFKKYMNWESLKEDYIQIYMSEFTENELKEMTAFYKTPLGQKLAEKSTVIAIKSSQISQQKMQAHMSELQEMLMQ